MGGLREGKRTRNLCNRNVNLNLPRYQESAPGALQAAGKCVWNEKLQRPDTVLQEFRERPPSTSVRLLPSLPGQMKDDFQQVEELTEGIPRKQNPTVVGMLGDQISLSQFLLRYQHLTALIRLHGGKTFPFLILLPAVLAPNPSQGWDASPQPQRALLGMRSLVQDRFPADN